MYKNMMIFVVINKLNIYCLHSIYIFFFLYSTAYLNDAENFALHQNNKITFLNILK